MILNELLQDKKMTKYRLCKESGVPQTTINDICSGKTKLEKCTVGTLYKIARALHVTLDSMVEAQLGDSATTPVASIEPKSRALSGKSPEPTPKTSPATFSATFSEPVAKGASEQPSRTSDKAIPKKIPEISFEDFRNNIRQQVQDMGDLDFILSVMKKDEIRTLYQETRLPEAFYLLGMLDYLSRENDLPIYSSYNDIRSRKLAEPIFPASPEMITDQYKKDALKKAIPEFLRFNIVETLG